jgi:hypothetical protein
MQHLDETLANICMKHLKTLETYACDMHVYAISRFTFATYRQNTCNICLEQMKYLKHTCIAITACAAYRFTFATSIYNTCNTPRKHLKYLKYTIATCAFNVASACCLDEWRLIDAELDASTDIKVAEWRKGHCCGALRWHGLRQGLGQRERVRGRPDL